MENLQPIPQPLQPSSKNPYKVLFFIALVLLFVFVSTLIFLFKNNKSKIIKNNQIDNQTKTLTGNTAPDSENTLTISDLQINLPKDWKIYYSTQNSAKILTETEPYKVYLIVSTDKSGENSHPENMPNNTPYGWVSTFDCGGPMACIDAMINRNYYQFIWNVEGDQPTPKDIGGVWRPDHKAQEEDLINIIKTAKPNTNLPWNSFSVWFADSFFQYPKNWSALTTDSSKIEIFDENQSNIITIFGVEKPKSTIYTEEGEFNRVYANYFQESDTSKYKQCSGFFTNARLCASKDLGSSTKPLKRYIIDLYRNNEYHIVFDIKSTEITPEIEMIISSFFR